MQLVENGLVYPYNVHELPKPLAGTEDVLSSIIGRLIDSLVVESKKAELVGRRHYVFYGTCLFDGYSLQLTMPASAAKLACFDVVDFVIENWFY